MSNRNLLDDTRDCIGLDLGDRWTHFHEENFSGELLGSGEIPTSSEELTQHFADRAPARIALEVGTHSPWISRLLASLGHEVIVANPREVKLISRAQRKNDRNDAKLLCWLLRADERLLFPIRHRGAEAQADLAAVRARDLLVAQRTRLVNHVRGAVKSFGGRVPSKITTQAFHNRAKPHIPRELRVAMRPVLANLAHVHSCIVELEREVDRMCEEKYPETQLLRQIPRVGSITSLTFILTIEDPSRFRRSREVGPYLGLVPRQHETGGSGPELGITKAGDRSLRRLLVQCAQQIVGARGPDSDLKRWGLAYMEKGLKNARKRAVVGVARKLAVLMHRLWVTSEVYEPLRNSEDETVAA